MLGSSSPAGEFWLQRPAPRSSGPLAGRLAAPLQCRRRWKQGRVSGSSVGQRTLFYVKDALVCLGGKCEWQTRDHFLVSSSFTVTTIHFWEQFWQLGSVSDTLVFLFAVGDFSEIIWKWHKHTLTVGVEPTDSCILWALICLRKSKTTKHNTPLKSPIEHYFLPACQWVCIVLSSSCVYVCWNGPDFGNWSGFDLCSISTGFRQFPFLSFSWYSPKLH